MSHSSGPCRPLHAARDPRAAAPLPPADFPRRAAPSPPAREPRSAARAPRAAHAAVLAALLVAASAAPWGGHALPGPLGPAAAHAQFGGDAPKPAELVRPAAAPVTIAAGQRGTVVVRLRILDTWHVNANPAATDYLIPTEVAIAGVPGVRAGAAQYPPPHEVRLAFDDNPLLVYDGIAEVRVPITVAAGAANGERRLKGTVSFQACNDQICLAPAQLPFEAVVTVTGGAEAPGGAPDGGAGPGDGGRAGAGTAPGDGAAGGSGTGPATTPGDGGAGPAPGGTGFTTAPPPGGGAAPALARNPIADTLERGGAWAFLSIFLVGLALNLTPCVYPMLGVTVSIFGARRAAPPAQVVGLALLYVLGMALMYSVLGLVAALTGGLFGAFLQSPWVLLGIGALMIALALSMFGLYELQPPPWLLERLGGNTATSAVGVFLSGLVVGVFAAPCIGPPVVALLAVVGQKGDPVFGFTTFFTLAMGLGFPYLLLGTFSNLIQNLPRSGDWMEWVKKVFGVVLVAVGLFYGLLALAPKQAALVVPAALALGGFYLGFLARGGSKKPAFTWMKRAVGAAGIVAGLFVWQGMQAKGIEFQAAGGDALQAAVAAGRPVMIDFSADWCVPCHELENFTFTDRRVIGAAGEFETFKVDLTRYDSPEAEAWRRQYDITGVPTIVFLGPGGAEVRAARVEGFMPPEPFLARMKLARAAARSAASD